MKTIFAALLLFVVLNTGATTSRDNSENLPETFTLSADNVKDAFTADGRHYIVYHELWYASKYAVGCTTLEVDAASYNRLNKNWGNNPQSITRNNGLWVINF